MARHLEELPFAYQVVFLIISLKAIKFWIMMKLNEMKLLWNEIIMKLNFSNAIKSFRWDQRAKLKYKETSLGKYGCKCPGKRKDKLQSSTCLHII